jgi:hypothetical protein
MSQNTQPVGYALVPVYETGYGSSSASSPVQCTSAKILLLAATHILATGLLIGSSANHDLKTKEPLLFSGVAFAGMAGFTDLYYLCRYCGGSSFKF